MKATMAIFDPNDPNTIKVVSMAGAEQNKVAYVQNGIGFNALLEELGEVDEFNFLLQPVTRKSKKAEVIETPELVSDDIPPAG